MQINYLMLEKKIKVNFKNKELLVKLVLFFFHQTDPLEVFFPSGNGIKQLGLIDFSK